MPFLQPVTRACGLDCDIRPIWVCFADLAPRCVGLRLVAWRCNRLHESQLRGVVEMIAADRAFSGNFGRHCGPFARSVVFGVNRELPKSRAPQARQPLSYQKPNK